MLLSVLAMSLTVVGCEDGDGISSAPNDSSNPLPQIFPDDNPLRQVHGNLKYTVRGLPFQTRADVWLTPTAGNQEPSFRLSTTATVEGLTPGIYIAEANVMAIDNVVYIPTLASSRVVIEPGLETRLTVEYRQSQGLVSSHQDAVHMMTATEGQVLTFELDLPANLTSGAPEIELIPENMPKILLFDHEVRLSDSGKYEVVVTFDSQYLPEDTTFIGNLRFIAYFGDYTLESCVTVIRHNRKPPLSITVEGLPSYIVPILELQNLETGAIIKFSVDKIPTDIAAGKYRLFVPYINENGIYWGVALPFSAITIEAEKPTVLFLDYQIQ